MLRNRQSCVAMLGLAGSLAVMACASPPSVATSAQAANPSGTVVEARAERLAEALAEAETAHAAGESDKLTRLVRSLRASGVRLAGDDGEDMLALWARAAGVDETPFRGRLLGPAYKRGELAPGERWSSAQTFVSGKPSTLAVSHNGAGPIRVSVSDQSSRLVCRPDTARRVACRFTPLYTQRYDIELVNEGSERAVYYLVFD